VLRGIRAFLSVLSAQHVLRRSKVPLGKEDKGYRQQPVPFAAFLSPLGDRKAAKGTEIPCTYPLFVPYRGTKVSTFPCGDGKGDR